VISRWQPQTLTRRLGRIRKWTDSYARIASTWNGLSPMPRQRRLDCETSARRRTRMRVGPSVIRGKNLEFVAYLANNPIVRRRCLYATNCRAAGWPCLHAIWLPTVGCGGQLTSLSLSSSGAWIGERMCERKRLPWPNAKRSDLPFAGASRRDKCDFQRWVGTRPAVVVDNR
jgi:hypothetical protein